MLQRQIFQWINFFLEREKKYRCNNFRDTNEMLAEELWALKQVQMIEFLFYD